MAKGENLGDCSLSLHFQEGLPSGMNSTRIGIVRLCRGLGPSRRALILKDVQADLNQG